MKITGKEVATMLHRSLNLLDYRLIDHGDRVAYLTLKILKAQGESNEEYLSDVYFLCLLHDLGAFKTENTDSLASAENLNSFELINMLPHSVYGCLFLKRFSPLAYLADAVLHHHIPYERLVNADCEHKKLAESLFIADRIDIALMNSGGLNTEIFEKMRGKLLSPTYFDTFIELEASDKLTEKLLSGEYLEELKSFYSSVTLSEQKALRFLETLVYIMDFRSPYTVAHTINTVGISTALAEILGVSGEELEKIRVGSLLHDLGKIATSIMVLEKTEKLDDYEFNIMRDHVVVTEYILKDCVSTEIMQIAVRHHEKLDGSGYPHHLTADSLSQNERIIAVADILSALAGKRSYKDSFPEEKIRAILQSSADSGKLCPIVTATALDNYTEIMNKSSACYEKALLEYNNLNEEYRLATDKARKANAIGG